MMHVCQIVIYCLCPSVQFSKCVNLYVSIKSDYIFILLSYSNIRVGCSPLRYLLTKIAYTATNWLADELSPYLNCIRLRSLAADCHGKLYFQTFTIIFSDCVVVIVYHYRVPAVQEDSI